MIPLIGYTMLFDHIYSIHQPISIFPTNQAVGLRLVNKKDWDDV